MSAGQVRYTVTPAVVQQPGAVAAAIVQLAPVSALTDQADQALVWRVLNELYQHGFDAGVASAGAASAVKAEPEYRVIAERLRHMILTGALHDGQRLPAVRELAQLWVVSVYAVGKAVEVLVREKLIIDHGRGRRLVCAPRSREKRVSR